MRRLAVLEKAKSTIHRVPPNATVILYGSEARGDAREDSDMDFLILLQLEQEEQFRKEKQKITEALLP